VNMEDAKAKPPQKPASASRSQALSNWGALVASFAAVGGLVFTGLSVRYQAEQTKLQTAASNAQTDQLKEQQAQLVNIWPTNEFAPRNILVTVSNRSEEPLYQFRLYIALESSGSRGYLAISTWSSFPPCSQVTFNLWPIAGSYLATSQLIHAGRHLPAFDYGIMFKDAKGQAFHRHASGTLHPTPWLEYLTGKHTYNPVLPTVFRNFTPLLADNFVIPQSGQKFVAVSPRTASACGSGV
jgi:hypothetical protein